MSDTNRTPADISSDRDSNETSNLEDSRSSSTDSYLDLLDVLTESVDCAPPVATAQSVLSIEHARRERLHRLAKLTAFVISVVSVFGGWWLGVRIDESSRHRVAETFVYAPFVGLFGVPLDESLIDAVINIDTPPPWAEAKTVDVRDTRANLVSFGRTIAEKSSDDVLDRIRERFDSLPDEQKRLWERFASQVAAMPEADRLTALARIEELRLLRESLSELERRLFDRLKGKDRLAAIARKTDFQKRSVEPLRKTPFTVADFNRPEFLMDLAVLTSVWTKMTPVQKKIAERRVLNLKTEPLRKVERLRQMAQNVESLLGEIPASKSEPNRLGSLQRALAKAEAGKRDREKRRAEFQQIVAGRKVEIDAAESEAFLETLPPWLAEVVDPLPPEEAQRFLMLLKLLVDHVSGKNGRTTDDG
jgi:hypothetical protein